MSAGGSRIRCMTPHHAATRRGIVAPVGDGHSGGPTFAQARGPNWRRTSRGLYVPAAVDGHSLQQRIAEAAAAMPAEAGIAGWAALSWLGDRWSNGPRGTTTAHAPIPIAVGHNRNMRPQPGLRISEEWLAAGDLTVVDGIGITRAERALCFEARHATSLFEAVRAIDTACSADLCSLEELAAYASLHLTARRKVPKFWRAIVLADENVWSPPESSMRLVWQVMSGFPRPLTNVPIFDLHGNHLLTPDLLDSAAGVAGEYDGALHLQDRTRRRDLDREAIYRDHDIELVTMMATDGHDVRNFQQRLASAYRRARNRPGTAQRTWTTTRPASWPDTTTVSARRAVDPQLRPIWIRRAG